MGSDTDSLAFTNLRPISEYRVVVRSLLDQTQAFQQQYGDETVEKVAETGTSPKSPE